MSAAFSCSMCVDVDAIATLLITAPTGVWTTTRIEITSCAACERDAVRMAEADEYAAGPAEVDPLSYLDGVA